MSRLALCLVITLLTCNAAWAAAVSFTGRIVEVTQDSGGVFTGATINTVFSASFTYPDLGGASTINEPHEADYEVIGNHSLSQGLTVVTGSEINVNIQDDQPLDQEEADFINALLNPVPPVTAGTPVDTWTIGGLQLGAYEDDPTPGDGDDTELLFNGVGFEYSLLSLDDTLFNDLSYRPIPPAFDQVDLRVFVVREGDIAGNLIFEAIGIIDQITPDLIFANDFED